MEKIIEMWLNPINLGILFLCITGGSGSWPTAIPRAEINKFRYAKGDL